MRGKRGRHITLLAIIGLLSGMGLGLWYGWEVDPLEYMDTDMAHLHEVHREGLLLMVSEAYALDGDLDAARARISLLSLPDPGNAVADLAERVIAQNWTHPYIHALVRMATAMDVRRDSFRPYQPSLDDVP